ncbi:MAG: tetratricopeptide repeat protein [Planctomycetota bacterium]
MPKPTPISLATSLTAALLLLLALPAASQFPAAPGEQLSPLVQRMLDDDLLSDAQRREAMIFHGQWDELEGLGDLDSLAVAVARYRCLPEQIDPFESFMEVPIEQVDPRALRLLARADYQAGRPDNTLDIYTDLQAQPTTSDRLLLARTYEDLGHYPKAIEMLAGVHEQAQAELDSFVTAAELTAGAEAIVMLARLEGRPSADYHLANRMLGKARDEIDPLYWPAYVAEAELLWARGNPQQAIEAVSEALSLNPKSSEAWYLLGSMMARFFNFDAASSAVEKLREINPEHPLADALAVQVALRQKDVETARGVIEPALGRYPNHRKLRSLAVAVEALAYDDAAVQEALIRWDGLAPGNPLAYFDVGQTLSGARQYALAEPFLKQAIERLPGWSAPQLELGELYMQWGKIEKAAAQLQIASSLDPFHLEITNQLRLSQEMLGYATIETDNFIIRYQPGVDVVLANDMARLVQAMADEFIERFQHDPPQKTQIDLMPDDQHFAVRVTGMPSIWTIAACTGDVIAMTPPRPGPKRAYGTYNWLNVMGHEYAHVVNLSQTNNRVPHWFTEGCAVNMETTGRLWRQYQLLAQCYNTDKLFEFDEINWGFIRPTEDYHRSLAYAQSAWIMEYIEKQHGWDKAIGLLDAFRRGVGERRAVAEVFGVEPEAFMQGFLDWAGQELVKWGMNKHGVEPEDDEITGLLNTTDPSTLELDRLVSAIEQHPGRPELIKLLAQATIARGDMAAGIEAVKRYQAARPVDPWSARELTKYALTQGDAAQAVDSMIYLDKIEGDAPEYASELARVYRANKDYEQAYHYAERALLREPYNPTYREFAATVAIQMGGMALAAAHVEALAVLEPTRAIHQKRLAALYTRLERPEDAAAARQRADELEAGAGR